MFTVYQSQWPSWTRLVSWSSPWGCETRKHREHTSPRQAGWDGSGKRERVLRKDTKWRGAQTCGGTLQETVISHKKVPGAKGAGVPPSWKDPWAKTRKSRGV